MALFFQHYFIKLFGRYVISKNPDDDRARVILRQTGLTSRAITYDDLLSVDLLEAVDYVEVDTKMQHMREEAFKYIENFLE